MKRTPLKKVSKKQAGRLRKLKKMYDEVFRENPGCFVMGCPMPGTEPHHVFGRTGDNLFNFKPCCREHHAMIHNNPGWAYANGYLEKRI